MCACCLIVLIRPLYKCISIVFFVRVFSGDPKVKIKKKSKYTLLFKLKNYNQDDGVASTTAPTKKKWPVQKKGRESDEEEKTTTTAIISMGVEK